MMSSSTFRSWALVGGGVSPFCLAFGLEGWRESVVTVEVGAPVDGVDFDLQPPKTSCDLGQVDPSAGVVVAVARLAEEAAEEDEGGHGDQQDQHDPHDAEDVVQIHLSDV